MTPRERKYHRRRKVGLSAKYRAIVNAWAKLHVPRETVIYGSFKDIKHLIN